MWQCKFSVYVFQYKNNELEDEWFEKDSSSLVAFTLQLSILLLSDKMTIKEVKVEESKLKNRNSHSICFVDGFSKSIHLQKTPSLFYSYTLSTCYCKSFLHRLKGE